MRTRTSRVTITAVASRIATVLVEGLPFVNFTASDADISTCSNCGCANASATPETANLPVDHDALRHHAKGTYLSICCSCASSALARDDADTFPRAVTRALVDIVCASGTTAAAAACCLRTMYNQSIAAADIRKVFSDLNAGNWVHSFLQRLEWHPSTAEIAGRIQPIPPNTAYAAAMLTTANLLVAISAYVKPATKRRITKRANDHADRFRSAAQSAFIECGNFGPFESALQDLLQHGDDPENTLWHSVFEDISNATPLATVTSQDRLALVHYWGGFCARAARIDLLHRNSAYTDAQRDIEFGGMVDMLLAYIAAPFRMPVSLGFTDPAHRVFVAYDGAIHRCVTMTEFVHCIATMYVFLPFDIGAHDRWRDTVSRGGHTADICPFECVTKPGHTYEDIRFDDCYSSGFDREWASPAASSAVRSAFGGGPLSDRNFAKLLVAAAGASASAAEHANVARLGAVRALAACVAAATEARTPAASRISSPSKQHTPRANRSGASSSGNHGSFDALNEDTDDDIDQNVSVSASNHGLLESDLSAISSLPSTVKISSNGDQATLPVHVPDEIWGKCSGVQRRRLNKVISEHTAALGNRELRRKLTSMISGIHEYGADHVMKDSGSDSDAEINDWLMLAGKTLKSRKIIPPAVRQVASLAQMSDIVRLLKAFNAGKPGAEAAGDSLIALLKKLLAKVAARANRPVERKKCCGGPITEECKCTAEDEEGKQAASEPARRLENGEVEIAHGVWAAPLNRKKEPRTADTTKGHHATKTAHRNTVARKAAARKARARGPFSDSDSGTDGSLSDDSTSDSDLEDRRAQQRRDRERQKAKRRRRRERSRQLKAAEEEADAAAAAKASKRAARRANAKLGGKLKQSKKNIGKKKRKTSSKHVRHGACRSLSHAMSDFEVNEDDEDDNDPTPSTTASAPPTPTATTPPAPSTPTRGTAPARRLAAATPVLLAAPCPPSTSTTSTPRQAPAAASRTCPTPSTSTAPRRS